MTGPCANSFLVLMLSLAPSACGSDKPRTGTTANVTGGAPSTRIDAGGDTSDASLTNRGGTTGEAGGAFSTDTGTNAASGGTSNTDTGLGGMTSRGGSMSGNGGVPATGGSSISPGLPSQCPPKAKSGQPEALLGLSLDAVSQFAAMTPDALTLVWTAPSATGVNVAVADRTSIATNWSAPQNVADVPAADGRVAITPDGLTLAYVDTSNSRKFATMSRLDRTSPFQFNDPTSGLDFIIQNGGSLLGADDTYAYPVYGPHLTSFYYAIKSAAGEYTWYVAGRFEQQGVFTEGTPIAFAQPPGASLVLSGVAWDENTLFFADTSTSATSWTFYDEPTTSFGTFSTIGSLGFVQPNESCTRLYGGPAGAINSTPLE